MRTLVWFIYFWLYLLFMLPKTCKINRLEQQGRLEERDAIVRHQVPRWAGSLLRLAGAKIQVSGQENLPEEPAVFIGNHQGNFDIPISLTCLGKPMGIVAKKELGGLPIIRTWMHHLQCVFIDRGDPRQSVSALNQAAGHVKNGYSMVIFPEGTRSRGDQLGQFKQGGFRVALKAGAPIVPFCIDGSYRLMEANKMWIRPATVKVTILPPVATAGLSKEEQKELPEKIRRMIEESKGK